MMIGTNGSLLSVFAFAISALIGVWPTFGFAAALGNFDPNFLTPRFPEDATTKYRVSLNPLGALGVVPLAGPTEADLAALSDNIFGFPGWVFTSGGAASGTFNMLRYDITVDRDLPMKFEVDYVPGAAGPPGAAGETLHWVQTVYTNDPCKAGLPNPYVDPQCIGAANLPDDSLPFYWTLVEVGGKRTPGGGIIFTDVPQRPLIEALKLAGGVTWQAHLLLASWNNDDTPDDGLDPKVTLYDGVQWGFRIVCAGAGTGASQKGGVAGDKEQSEEQGSATGETGACQAGVPVPSTGILLAAGVLTLLLWSIIRHRECTG